jgi:hypothetical protein
MLRDLETRIWRSKGLNIFITRILSGGRDRDKELEPPAVLATHGLGFRVGTSDCASMLLYICLVRIMPGQFGRL